MKKYFVILFVLLIVLSGRYIYISNKDMDMYEIGSNLIGRDSKVEDFDFNVEIDSKQIKIEVVNHSNKTYYVDKHHFIRSLYYEKADGWYSVTFKWLHLGGLAFITPSSNYTYKINHKDLLSGKPLKGRYFIELEVITEDGTKKCYEELYFEYK